MVRHLCTLGIYYNLCHQHVSYVKVTVLLKLQLLNSGFSSRNKIHECRSGSCLPLPSIFQCVLCVYTFFLVLKELHDLLCSVFCVIV